MSLPELDNLVRIGKLKAEPGAPVEFDGLMRSGMVRLRDAENTTNSLEGRFDLAYNAAHALSLAALRWHGYRSESRYLVFQNLTHTLKLPAEHGACSTSRIANATSPNMKAIWTLIRSWSQLSSV